MTIAEAQVAILILAGIAIASPRVGDTLKVGPSETYETYKASSAVAAVAKTGGNAPVDVENVR